MKIMIFKSPNVSSNFPGYNVGFVSEHPVCLKKKNVTNKAN